MKKILYVYHVSSVGGGSYCLLNILKTIDRNKFQPIVLLSREGPLCEEIRKLNIEVYFLSSICTVPYNAFILRLDSIFSIISILKSLKKYGEFLDMINPDIVYINTMMLYPYLVFAKKKKIKTIIHIREHWPEDEHKIQRKIALNVIKRYSDKIVAINHYSASMLEDYGKEVTIIYDWIDFKGRYKYMSFDELFKEDCSALKVYLFLGGVVSLKGGLTIVDTFINKMKDSNNRLLVLGVDSQIYYRGIIGKIRKVLSLLGIRSRSDKLKLLIQRDKRILCIPATNAIQHLMEQAYCILSYFTIPHANLALAEAMILKTPTIAARTPESIEYTCDEEFPLLFEINDVDDFISKIHLLDRQYEVVKQRIQCKSAEVRYLFDKKRNVNILNELINFN